MGLGNLPVGLGGAVALITTPQLLAARDVPETSIANVTSIMLVSTFTAFLFSPILDWRFSRRTYAVALALASGLLCFTALISISNLFLLSVALLCLGWATNLNNAALGGWFSDLASTEETGPLGAWLTIANIVGVGGTSAIAILAIRDLPPILGPALISALFLLPLPIYLAIPATAPDTKLAQETFAQFWRDVLALLSRPIVRWLLFFLAMPAASFALSNTLPGLGKDFGASEAFVGAICGVGIAIAGLLGSLVVPPLARGLPPDRLYLIVGSSGAVFSLLLVLLPHTPTTFAIAIIGQNGFWAASFSVIAIIALRANGRHHPLAATQFALLSAAAGLPLTYMQFIDGHAYAFGRTTGSFFADATISLAACAILGVMLFVLQQRASLKDRPRETLEPVSDMVAPDTLGDI